MVPFEFGALYKPCENVQINCDIDWNQKPTFHFSNYINGNIITNPHVIVNYVDWSYGFEPIAFIESKGMVVGNVFANEAKNTPILIPEANGYGINFQTNNIVEQKKRSFRVEIEVNEFIKNFEKIL